MTNDINFEKVEQANQLLEDIISLVKQYELLTQQMKVGEQLLSGVMVVAINSDWKDKKILAAIGNSAFATMAINMLVNWFNSNARQAQKPALTPFTNTKIN